MVFYYHSNTSGKQYINLKGSYHSVKKLTINVDLNCCGIYVWMKGA